jgi:hypothetical protein
MNTSFDASKSANTINYVGSAYMSNIPTTHGSNIPQSSGAKLSKVGLKHTTTNSRQQNNMQGGMQNNYTDGTAVFIGNQTAARQMGVTSHSQGPAMGSSHKTLYMSQQDRMQEIGKVYNY